MNLFIIIGIILFACDLFLMYRNQKMYDVRSDVREAISDYNLDQILHGDYNKNKISYDCMENYSKTIFRLFDFSNKKIVPHDIFEKIEKYL